MCFELSHFCQIRRSWDEFKSLQTALPCWSVLGHTGVRRQRGEQSSCKRTGRHCTYSPAAPTVSWDPCQDQQYSRTFGNHYNTRDSYACLPKHPQLNFLSDSVFSIKVLQRQSRARSNVKLIQCERAPADQARRITQVTFQHVKAHSGLLFNEMADRVADAARKRVRLGARAPFLRPSVAGQG